MDQRNWAVQQVLGNHSAMNLNLSGYVIDIVIVVVRSVFMVLLWIIIICRHLFNIFYTCLFY